MKISAQHISLSALTFGLVFMAGFEPKLFPQETADVDKKYAPGQEVIERLGPDHAKVLAELDQLEQDVASKGSLSLDEYLEVQSQLDKLLQRVNDTAVESGDADAELFGEILQLQEVVVGIDVR